MTDKNTIREMINAGNALIVEGEKMVEKGKTASEKGRELVSGALYLAEYNGIDLDGDKSQISNKKDSVVQVKQLDSDFKDYPIKGTILQKAKYLLDSFNRFVTKAQIVERAFLIEKDKKAKNQFAQLSQFINDEDGFVNKRVGLSNNNTVWGFSVWLDDDKKIKKEFCFDREKLQYKVSDEDFAKVVETKTPSSIEEGVL